MRARYETECEMLLTDFLLRWGRGEAGHVVSKRWAKQRAAEISMHVLSLLGAPATFSSLTPRALLTAQRAIIESGASPTTANIVIFGSLRAMLRDAEIEGIVPPGFRSQLYAPIRRLRTTPIEDRAPFSLAERDAILAEFRVQKPHWLPFVMTAFGTGARPGELLGLTWRDVDLARKWLRIARSRGEGGVTPGKTVHSRREIRLTRLAVTGLSALAADPGPPDGYVFLGPRGRPLDLHNFSFKVWKPILSVELAGRVTYRPFYATRHTFISAALLAGKSPAEVAVYCGNSVDVIQRHYFRFVGVPGEGWDEVASVPTLSIARPAPPAATRNAPARA